MSDLSWYEEMRNLSSWIEFDEEGFPILIDLDDDNNQIELRKITPLEYAATLIISKHWEIFNGKLRTAREFHSLTYTGGNGINVISDVTEDEEEYCIHYMGCIYDLTDERFNEEHEEIIQMALDEHAPYEARYALVYEIERCLEKGRKLASPYIKLISNGLYGRIDKPKHKKIPLNQWLYPILRETIDEVHETFDIQIGRNPLNDTSECVLEIVVEATNKLGLHKSFNPDKFVNISYETLRREFYKSIELQAIETYMAVNEKEARKLLKEHTSKD